MINFTEQQSEAIFTRNSNILVSAAAGSGKTMVLVERVVNLIIEEKIDIENFLIVTFTNAAAKQMVDKIREKLFKALEENDDKFIRKQIFNLANANISTMHSFCIKILREYYEYVGISPNFKIVNSASEAVIKSNAMELTLEEEYEKSLDDFIDFLDAYGDGRGNKFAEIIDCVYSNIQNQADPIKWLEDKSNIEDNYLKEIMAYISEELNDIIELYYSAIRICDEPFGPDKYKKNIENDILLIDDLLSYIKRNDYEGFVKNLKTIKYQQLAPIKSTDESVDHSKKEAVKKIRDKAKKLINEGIKKDFENKTLEQINYENALASSYLKTLTRLIKSYDKNLKILKEENNVLSFSDVEHLALQLLNIPEINKNIKEKLTYIFYDEYQDINPLQEMIISEIQKEDNLFFVGDIKQSIYKFRLADPSIFNKRYKEYSATDNGKLVKLSNNFRSSHIILDFLNFIFYKLMTPSLGEVDYTDEGQALSWLSEDKAGKVNLIINEEKKDREYGELKANSNYIAKEIKRLVEEEGYKYRDIVILMRNVKNRIEDYEDALDYYDIPYYSDFTGISLEKIEVALFIDMLRIINNANDDQSLVSVLLTPFGGFDENELAIIRSQSPTTSFYQAIKSYDNDDFITNKINQFFNKIDKYRKEERTMKLSDFAYRYGVDSSYFSYIQASDNGQEKFQNVLAFIQRIEDYEEISYSSLADFLVYVDTLLDSPSESLEPTKLISESEDVVRLMTIHKSKGLEFKVIFLTDMERNFKLHEKSDNYIIDDELGIGLKVVDKELNTIYKTAHRKIIESKKENEMKSEELRLLYVGATRAEEVLYLVGSSDKPEEYLQNLQKEPLDFSLKKAKSMMDWYLTVAVRDRLFTIQLADVLDSGENSYFEDNFPAVISINPYESILAEEKSEIVINIVLNQLKNKDLIDVNDIIDFQYKDIDKTVLPYKNTVSNISTKNISKTDDTAEFPNPYKASFNFDGELPDILIDDSNLSPQQRGSLIHFVFQNISYENHTKESVKDELNRMVTVELLTKAEADSINPDIFVQFFKTSLAKRIRKNLPTLTREKSFTMKYKDIYIDGQIDGYFIEDGEIVLFDIKTDSTMSPTRYNTQLSLYKKALETAYNIKVKEVYIYWTTFNKVSKINF